LCSKAVAKWIHLIILIPNPVLPKFRISLCMFLLVMGTNLLYAQPIIKPLGGYVHVSKDYGWSLTRDIDVSVYFASDTAIPDSIYAVSEDFWIHKSFSTTLCNGVIRQNYSLNGYSRFSPDNVELFGVRFQNVETRFAGKNADSASLHSIRPFTLVCNIPTWSIYKYFGLASMHHKDMPLLIARKNTVVIVNYNNDIEENTDKITYNLGENLPNSPTAPGGMFQNGTTGDISVNTTGLDTGDYTFIRGCEEWFYENYKAVTYYVATLRVTNDRIPYFDIPLSQPRDSVAVPFLFAKPADTVLTFECDYICPIKKGPVTFSLQSAITFNKAPQIIPTWIDDTVAQLRMKIYMDTGMYKVYERLPKSISIIATATDSLGNCSQDMTSFYITRDITSNTLEVDEEKNLLLYPNPANDEVSIRMQHGSDVTGISLLDMLGRFHPVNFMFTNNELKVSLKDQPAGIYIVFASTRSGAVLQKRLLIN
jgi:hypothetical protein